MRSVPTSSNASQLQQVLKRNLPISLYPLCSPLNGASRAGNQAVNAAVEQGNVVLAAGTYTSSRKCPWCSHIAPSGNADGKYAPGPPRRRSTSARRRRRTHAHTYRTTAGAWASSFREPTPSHRARTGHTPSRRSIAAPHTVGFVADLLDIYPSETFDPPVADSPRATPNFFGVSECVYVVLRAVSPCPFASILLRRCLMVATRGPLRPRTKTA
jgi:hypothetical protein